MALFEDIDEKQFINLTPEWIAENYDRMNRELFDSKLGQCSFDVFTTGKGCEGGTLGRFCIRGNIKADARTRRMFKLDILSGEKIFIDRNNFDQLCNPLIVLNGNYRWSYKAALSTLVHEMCHYYVDSFGWLPKQSHGQEFKYIAAVVSDKSNEFFTVQRLSCAEKMSEMELKPEYVEKRQKRAQSKLKNFIATFVFREDGNVELTNCVNVQLLKHIVNLAASANFNKTNKIVKIVASVDDDLKEVIYNSGYKSVMRSWRYWDIKPDSPILEKLKTSNSQVWYSADEDESSKRMSLAEAKRLIRKLTAQVLEEAKF